ncbi:MAG: hypothetical protein Q8M29_14250 [Bacteroidota bacterium]|nr:hypothetical protein [Bacteroidota bacterium]
MESKKPFIITILIAVILLAILSFFIYDLNKSNKLKEDNLRVLESNLANESIRIAQISKTKDSLLQRVNYFQHYTSLVDATFFRDSTTQSLKYKAGDIVLLKPDSSKVVIKEIIIGGTQYEHYIKYKVVLKDRSQLEITPEMLY